jgi:hypothetical protein
VSSYPTMPTPPTASRRFEYADAYAPTSVAELDSHPVGFSLIAWHGDGLEFVWKKTALGFWSPQVHRAIRAHVIARYPVAERRLRDDDSEGAVA